MPTYEYACTECGRRIETFQRISDPPLEMCDVCGGKLRKLFHPAGIVFKGSGFYSTDNRSTDSRSGKGEKKSEASEGSKDGGKAPSEKPQEKTA